MSAGNVWAVSLSGVAILFVVLLWPFAGSLPAADDAPPPTWNGTEVTNSSGAIEVHSPDTPMYEDGRATLRLDWRLTLDGQDDEIVTTPTGQELPLIGMITAVEEGDDGRVYVLDTQMKHVLVFTEDGKFLGVRSGAGSGPGETDLPVGVLRRPGGGLGIAQGTPAKIIVFGQEGIPQKTHRLSMSGEGATGFVVVQRIEALGNGMVVSGTAMAVTGSEKLACAFISIMDGGGREVSRVMERTTPVASMVSGSGLRDLADVTAAPWACRQELYVAGDPDRYCISVYGEDGRCQRVISREYQRIKYTEAERAGMQQAYDRMARRFPMGGGLFGDVPEYAPCIMKLIPRPDGSLWVQPSDRSYGLGLDGIIRYDVFDKLGRYECRIGLQPEEFEPGDQLFFLRDCVIVVRGMAAKHGDILDLPGADMDPGTVEISLARYVIVS